MYPIATPMECAPTGMWQAGCGRQATQGGPQMGGVLEVTGVQVPCCGGRGFPNPGWLSRSSPLLPAAPRRLRSSWVRTYSRYMPRPATGGKAGLCRLSAEGGRGCHLGAQVESLLKLLASGSPGGGMRNRAVGGGEQQPGVHNSRAPSQVEQRLEPAKRAAHNVHKRLQACLQGQSGADMDKRVVSGGPKDEGAWAGHLCPVGE